MRYIFITKQALQEVFAKQTYWVIAITIAFLMFTFNVLIANYSILISRFSFSLLFGLFIGTVSIIPWPSLTFLIVTSVLAGILIAQVVFLIRRQLGVSVGSGSTALIAAVAAPACPSCAIGLFSVVGLSSFFGFLPFKGLELGVVGVVVLTLSIGYLSAKITTKICKVTILDKR